MKASTISTLIDALEDVYWEGILSPSFLETIVVLCGYPKSNRFWRMSSERGKASGEGTTLIEAFNNYEQNLLVFRNRCL
jgi:hypothetical protein